MEHQIIKELYRIKMEKQYTYDDLAKLLDIPSQTIARWVRKGRINKSIAGMLKESMRIL